MAAKNLLIVYHSKTGKTERLADAVYEGANDALFETVSVTMKTAHEAGPNDIIESHGLLLGTPENFGYMSGAMKDFFDRTYYPCLEHTRGRPYGLLVKAGGDGSGAVAAVLPLATGLEWRPVLEPLVVAGDITADHLTAARELGGSLAAGLAGDLW